MTTLLTLGRYSIAFDAQDAVYEVRTRGEYVSGWKTLSQAFAACSILDMSDKSRGAK
jgi:hypothetical protein